MLQILQVLHIKYIPHRKKTHFLSVPHSWQLTCYFCSMENVIKSWIENPNHSYDEGVALFVKFGGNRFQARYFENTQARFAIKKLTYELGKLVKLGKGNVESQQVVPDGQPQGLDSQPLQPVNQPQEQDGTETKKDIPEVAAIAKRIVHETWVEISRITEELYNVGTGNNKASKAKRKSLLNERLPLIERYNQVYEAKEAFFSGELTEEQLLVVVENKPEEPKAKQKPVDYKKLSDLQLDKKIHSTKQAINRATNQLLYQQDTKGEKENPLPDCPRKKELEERLAMKRIELDDLVAEYERRGISGTA